MPAILAVAYSPPLMAEQFCQMPNLPCRPFSSVDSAMRLIDLGLIAFAADIFSHVLLNLRRRR